jgi:hypothetical protein
MNTARDNDLDLFLLASDPCTSAPTVNIGFDALKDAKGTPTGVDATSRRAKIDLLPKY